MFVMPTYWGFAAMQMGVQVMAAQMRMAQAIYEAGLSQQRALWGMRAPLAPALPMSVPVPVGMGICGPVALAGAARPQPRPRAGRALRAVPGGGNSSRRYRAASQPSETPAPASDGGDDKTPV